MRTTAERRRPGRDSPFGIASRGNCTARGPEGKEDDWCSYSFTVDRLPRNKTAQGPEERERKTDDLVLLILIGCLGMRHPEDLWEGRKRIGARVLLLMMPKNDIARRSEGKEEED